MKTAKANSIMLYKQAKTQADSRGLNISTSRSKLINDLRKLNHSDSSSRITPSNYNLQNKPYLKACNMEDPQIRIKRDHSPLYQRSSKQSQLFQTGLKKSETNINLISKINLAECMNTEPNTARTQDLSPRIIKRQDPNKQNQNIFELGAKPPLSSRTTNKRNPNVQSECKQPRKQKSKIKDKNIETNKTADYVIKALSTHTSAFIKQIHMKFNKKQNLPNIQNSTKQNLKQPEKGITRQHKRHFSHVALQANKQNIERKQNGICIKDDYVQKNKHQRKQFNHDFYKKQNRIDVINKEKELNNKQKGYQKYTNIKTARNHQTQPNNKAYLKTQYNETNNHQLSRVAQLRKRLL